MLKVSRGGLAALIGSSILVLAACSGLGLATPSPDFDGPRWAGLLIVGEPETADRPIDLEIRVLPEDESLRHTTIPAGTIIRWDEGLSSGHYRLLALGGECADDIELPPERGTTVILRHATDPCAFGVDAHAPDLPSGNVAATVTLQPWEGLVVDAISLADPPLPVPAPVPPDEGGLAQLSPLYPGRYEIRLRRGAVVLETQQITILARGRAGDLVELVLDGVQD